MASHFCKLPGKRPVIFQFLPYTAGFFFLSSSVNFWAAAFESTFGRQLLEQYLASTPLACL